MEFILSDENFIFNCALVVMFAIAVIEGVGTIIGMGVGNLLDSILPDIDFDADVEIDADVHMTTPSLATNFLGWLHIGQVPVLILIIVFLTSFGLIGLTIQKIIVNTTGGLWSGGLLALPVFIASLPVVSVIGGLLSKLFPKDETEAVSENSFIGGTAVITLGNATKGKAIQARITDQFGQSHYILVEPEIEDETLYLHQVVKVIARHGNIYTAISVDAS